MSHQIYEKYLDDKYKKLFRKQWDLYLSDPFVKRRTLDKKKEREFIGLLIKIFNYCCFITKGKRDFDALNNSSLLILNKHMPELTFENHYDIEIYNPFSRNMFGSAQLEVTYKNFVRLDVYKIHAEFLFDRIMSTMKGAAHNPVIDSVYAMVVAVVVNLMLNDGINPIMSGGVGEELHYYKKYLKYKTKYLEIIHSV